MRWRSPSEIGFRLRQEAGNLALLARPPKLPEQANPKTPFPDADSAIRILRSTPYAHAITAWADQILLHRFPLLGIEIETGPEIHWRRDYVSGKETPPRYFRRIPYLDASVSGDHKIIWELNRHQHMVLLAQAYRLTGKRAYLEEIEAQLGSWFEENPVQHGINWASALEVAFRSLSWMWVDVLGGQKFDPAQRRRMMEELYRHAFYLELNLSIYFSPNTHVIGEAVALHALGLMFQGTPPAERWKQTGARIVTEQMQAQVRADGSHFEQSSYYHVYALDMFLFHAMLANPGEEYLRVLERMAEYLDALTGPSRKLSLIGDDDGGRFFHPFGCRDQFARATLAACGQFLKRPEWIRAEGDLYEIALWWMAPEASLAKIEKTNPTGSVRFPDSGIVVMRAAGVHAIVDAGPFGPYRGGHNHADTLSLIVSLNDQDLLIDPGTYTYGSDSPWRNRFRGTAAHNTIRVGQLDQSEHAGNFGWDPPPRVETLQWRSDDALDFLDASCSYRGFRHRRRIFFLKPELLFILDDVEGANIDAEQFWHPGIEVSAESPGCFRIGEAATLVLSGGTHELSHGGEFGWRSTVYGSKVATPLIVSRLKGEGSLRFGAVLSFLPTAGDVRLLVSGSHDEVEMLFEGVSVKFPGSGTPQARRSVIIDDSFKKD